MARHIEQVGTDAVYRRSVASATCSRPRSITDAATIVAEKIREIIESGTRKLRHPVGPDSEAFLGWRASLNDEQWVEWGALLMRLGTIALRRTLASTHARSERGTHQFALRPEPDDHFSAALAGWPSTDTGPNDRRPLSRADLRWLRIHSSSIRRRRAFAAFRVGSAATLTSWAGSAFRS